jgi:hypothetical protein
MITKASNTSKAFFPHDGDHTKQGFDYILSVITQNTADPITEFNHFCLKRNINCILFNRVTILDFSSRNPILRFSNNTRSTQKANSGVNSS